MNNNDLRIEADTCTAIRTHQCTFDQRCPPRKGGSQHSLPDKRNTKQNHIKLINPKSLNPQDGDGWGWMEEPFEHFESFWEILGSTSTYSGSRNVSRLGSRHAGLCRSSVEALGFRTITILMCMIAYIYEHLAS